MKQHYLTKRKYGVLFIFVLSFLILFTVTKIYINDQHVRSNELYKISEQFIDDVNYYKKISDADESISYKYWKYENFQVGIVLTFIIVSLTTLHYSYKSKFIAINIILLLIGSWVMFDYIFSYENPELNHLHYLILLPFPLLIIEHLILGKKINISQEVYNTVDEKIVNKKNNLKELFQKGLINTEEYESKMKEILKEEMNIKGLHSDDIILLNKSLNSGIISKDEYQTKYNLILENEINKLYENLK